jgi:predicted dehydrogenase
LRLVTATLCQPWLSRQSGPEESWRLDPRVSGGGILCDTGDHLVDTLLWMTGRAPVEAFAFQERHEGGPDLVTAAAVLLSDGLPATLGISGVSPNTLFEIHLHGEGGTLRVSEGGCVIQEAGGEGRAVSVGGAEAESVDADFVRSVVAGEPSCCSADDALGTVRLLEGIARSAATGKPVRLVGSSGGVVASS